MKKYFLYPALFSIFFAASCNDGEKFQGPPDNTDPKSTNEYFLSNLEDMKQEFKFDNSGDDPATLTSKGGLKITIQPGTFTIDGETVEGEVDIVLYEMLTMSSIALSGTNTNYWGNHNGGNPAYFQTDGFFNIDATANGVQVDQKLAQNLRVVLPNKLREDTWYTELWPGTEEAGENGDLFAWVDDGENDWRNGLEANEMKDFEFDLGKLGWCNCDVFCDNPKNTLTVELTGDFGKFANYLAAEGETYVLFAMKGFPVLAQLYNVVNESTVESYLNSIPDCEGRLFAFSILDGKYTYAEQEITINDHMEVTLDMEEKTKEYIDSRLKTLDGYK